MSTIDYKEEAKFWMKKPTLDENRIKVRDFFILISIICMNVELLFFIVIFYVASLASPQI
jgi:hypothetical protein